jgi:hypothetical protein
MEYWNDVEKKRRGRRNKNLNFSRKAIFGRTALVFLPEQENKKSLETP